MQTRSFARHKTNADKMLGDLQERERNSSFNVGFQRRYHFTNRLIDSLDMCGELTGHDGCVNAVEWNETGDMLASGSDDQQIILWRPFRQQLVAKIDSGHTGNIFSVKFVPGTGSQELATAAADSVIFVRNLTSEAVLFECRCHSSRVKRLQVTELEPYLIWSAGEDGMILQNDVRCKHRCTLSGGSSGASNCAGGSIGGKTTVENLLINLNSSFNYGVRAKCLAINRRKPEQLAVGCSDPFVRLFDRRMIRPVCMETFSNFALTDNVPMSCAQFYKPGYQPWYRSQFSFYSCTFLSFSPDGRHLLANMGGGHAYLYDVQTPQSKSTSFDVKAAKDFYSYRYLKKFYSQTENVEASLSQRPHSTSARSISCVKRDAARTGFYTFQPTRPEKRPKTSKSYGDPSYLSLLNQATFVHRALTQQVYRFCDSLPDQLQALKEFGNKFFKRGDLCDAIRVYNDMIWLLPNCVVVRCSRAIALYKRGWEGDCYQAFRDCLHALQFDLHYAKAHFWLAKSLLKLDERDSAYHCVRIFRRLFSQYGQMGIFNELEQEIKESMNEFERSCQQRRPHENAEFNRAKLITNRVYDGKERNWDFTYEVNHSPEVNAEKLLAELRRFEERTRIRGITQENEQSFEQIVRRIVKAFPNEPNVMKERIWRLKANDFVQRYTGHLNMNTDIKEANFLDSEGKYIVAGSDGGHIFIWDRHTANILKVLKSDETIVNCVQPHQSSSFIASSGIDKVIRLWSPNFSPSKKSRKHELKYKKLNRLMSFNQTRLNVKCVEMFLMNVGYGFEDVSNFRDDSDSSEDEEEEDNNVNTSNDNSNIHQHDGDNNGDNGREDGNDDNEEEDVRVDDDNQNGSALNSLILELVDENA